MSKATPKKTVKVKAKPITKAAASKAPKKVTKPVKSIVKTIVKAAQKVLTPKAEKEKPTKAAKHKEIEMPSTKGVKKDLKKEIPKAEKKIDKIEKKLKKAKAGKKDSKRESKRESDEIDLGDDLVGDEDMGAEDIPDLAEFDEIEIEIDETEELILEAREGDVPRASDEEIILTDAEGRRYCRVRDCDQIGVVEGYCRFHYLQLWKRIQIRRKILVDGKLERYVEELTSRYPDKFLEMIRKDLRNEKDFLAAIAELEIDESAVDSEFEDESASFIEEVRGMSESSAGMSDDDEF